MSSASAHFPLCNMTTCVNLLGNIMYKGFYFISGFVNYLNVHVVNKNACIKRF